MHDNSVSSNVNIEMPEASPAATKPRTNTIPPASKQADVEQPMDMSVQQPQQTRTRPGDGDVDASVPGGWDLRVLPAPYTKMEGHELVVMVVANIPAALRQEFADPIASAAAVTFGLAGRPVIVAKNPRHFPIDPETFKPCEATHPGCIWAKYITLTTRG